MFDSTLDTKDDRTIEQPPINSYTSPQTVTPSISFLTVSYNPAAHPRQISLLDVNGQPILYTLMPSNGNMPVQANPQPQSYHLAAVPPNMNVCCICGGLAADKCSYGISTGRPCGRLLCLAHIVELPGIQGGRYPHCPEHYHHIQQNKCHVM